MLHVKPDAQVVALGEEEGVVYVLGALVGSHRVFFRTFTGMRFQGIGIPYGQKTHLTFISCPPRLVQTGPKTGFAISLTHAIPSPGRIFFTKPTDCRSAALGRRFHNLSYRWYEESEE